MRKVTFSLENEFDPSPVNIKITGAPTRKKSQNIETKGTILLFRGSSCSLVELPTFLPASSSVQTVCQHRCCQPALPETDTDTSLAEVLSFYQPKKETLSGQTSQWTVMCVTITFFTTCLLLVGFMLSITSDYQDIAIAKVLNGTHERT